MTPQTASRMRIATYALIVMGIAGLIGAHEWGGEPSRTTAPLIFAAVGTLCFVAAGLLARKLMKG